MRDKDGDRGKRAHGDRDRDNEWIGVTISAEKNDKVKLCKRLQSLRRRDEASPKTGQNTAAHKNDMYRGCRKGGICKGKSAFGRPDEVSQVIQVEVELVRVEMEGVKMHRIEPQLEVLVHVDVLVLQRWRCEVRGQ